MASDNRSSSITTDTILNSPSSSFRLHYLSRSNGQLASPGSVADQYDGERVIEGESLTTTELRTKDESHFRDHLACNVSHCSRSLLSPTLSGESRPCHSPPLCFESLNQIGFNRTTLAIRFALLLVPLLWLSVLTLWAVCLVRANSSPEVEEDRLATWAIQLTITTLVVTLLVTFVYLAHSNWPYSFVFIPNVEDNADYRVCVEMDTDESSQDLKTPEKVLF